MQDLIPLSAADVRFLRRIALHPDFRPSKHALELGVTRSAISQLMKRLRRTHNLQIRGLLNHDTLGLKIVFGWGRAETFSQILTRFARWLQSHPFVYLTIESSLTSRMDFRVYFEALLPTDEKLSWFLHQLERFTKRPYKLDVQYDVAIATEQHTNFAIFDGQSWNLDRDFHFEAQMDAAKSYTDVLPTVFETIKTPPIPLTSLDMILVAALVQNYFVTATEVVAKLAAYNFPLPTPRTIRRKLAVLRGLAVRPYLHIENIGLPQRILTTIVDLDDSRRVSRLLIAQAGMFPLTRVVTGSTLTVLDLLLPKTIGLSVFFSSISYLAGEDAYVCTFITDISHNEKELEAALRHIAHLKLESHEPESRCRQTNV